jgi:uncharacterized OB-fold protein
LSTYIQDEKMKFGYTSWLPETAIISTFSSGLEDNKLLGTKCKGCGAKYLPPRNHCRCGSNKMEWFEAPPNGKILTYTLVAQPSESMSKYAPYVIAIAELEDGSRILGQFSDGTTRTLKVGLQVKVVFQTVAGKGATYKFTPK